MDKQYGKISSFGLASIIFLSTGMVIHVLVMPIMLQTAGRDAWLSVLAAAPFFCTWLFLLFKFIHILNGKPFLDWVKEKWGKLGLFITIVITVMFLLFIVVHTIADTMIWTISTYMQNTPFFIIGFVLISVCLFLAYNGIQSISIVASLLLPIVTFLGFFVSFVNDKHKDYSLLLPLLEHGYPPLINGAIIAFIAFCDCWIILFISHDLKRKPTLTFKIGFLLFLIVLFVGPIIGGITEFGPKEASMQRYTAFDQWKILSLGRLLQHVDFLSIYQWLSGSLIRVALSIYLIGRILGDHKPKRKPKIYIFIWLFLFVMIFMKWRADITLSLLYKYYFPICLVTIIVFTILIILTLLISKIRSDALHKTTDTNSQKEGE